MMFSYSLSFPLLSFHLRYITDASTLAGLDVFGSFSKLTWEKSSIKDKCVAPLGILTTERSIVRTFWVGFHLSQGSSPDWGSSTGGCRMDTHRSPFCTVSRFFLLQRDFLRCESPRRHLDARLLRETEWRAGCTGSPGGTSGVPVK